MSEDTKKPTEDKVEDAQAKEAAALKAKEEADAAEAKEKEEAAAKAKSKVVLTVDPFVVIHSDPKDKDALVEAMPIGKLGCIVVRKGAAVFVPGARIVTREKVTTVTS